MFRQTLKQRILLRGAGLAVALMMVAMPSLAAERLEDPTRPTPLGGDRRSTPAKPDWILNSTLVSADRRLAVINGRAVAVGDQIGGARVVRVEQEAVWLEYQGNRFRLTLRSVADIKSRSQ